MSKEISRRLFLKSLIGGVVIAVTPSTVLAQSTGEEIRADVTSRGDRPTQTDPDGLTSEDNIPKEECVPSGSWEGTCTYYSHAGCVGCSPGQIMANGEPFREWGMTIAFMQLPLNTYVRVTNIDTGKSVIAKVADRGGFWKYGILADLSLGVSVAVGNQSRSSRIRINTLDCD